MLTPPGEIGAGTVQRSVVPPDHAGMYTYRTTVTLPSAHRDRAVEAVRTEVQRLSTMERGLEVPDWSTMVVDGPMETYGPRGQVVFEYRGVVRGRNLAERRAGRR